MIYANTDVAVLPPTFNMNATSGVTPKAARWYPVTDVRDDARALRPQSLTQTQGQAMVGSLEEPLASGSVTDQRRERKAPVRDVTMEALFERLSVLEAAFCHDLRAYRL